MPSSVSVGSRSPRSCLIFSYSSKVRPCCRSISGEKAEVMEVVMGKLYCRIWQGGWVGVQIHLSFLNYRSSTPRLFRPGTLSGKMTVQMKSIIIGTAGHIDHGKTALVKALTGIDADRLEEEKRRGITIDIGFAHLELPAPDGSRLRLGFVDVPGHERFVRNMLAGVGGIDLVLLVIAADEGIKPQTREHFDILQLLGVKRGITVLTKSDAVDSETLEIVRLEAEDYVRGSFLDTTLAPVRSPIIAVSSLTGAGLDELKSALANFASEVTAKNSAALARLPVDRVFTMK